MKGSGGQWVPPVAFVGVNVVAGKQYELIGRVLTPSAAFVGVGMCCDRHTKASDSHQPPKPPVSRTATQNPPSGLHTRPPARSAIGTQCKSVETPAAEPYLFHERRRRTPAASAPFAPEAHPPIPPPFRKLHPTATPV
ncbi:hypothetical protein GALMADRAFT_138718 [Galerina marginata CBS 339.88]|uniref:Uncharacterized protein n=1 Tax=Galerina marginata (strain CBS 339.88) TaxID=685588 RepID=A0A067T5K9_GALM3|nr:hypothetical protein GALMADRAFT_138718 [Galerina marginata CBS 339.88]